VVELTSKELDAPLSIANRLVMKFHRFACSACRRFRVQLVEVDRMSSKFISESCLPRTVCLPDKAREKIEKVLREAVSSES
jgi:predicted anti-sigma-YlaC factor YlaD